MVTAQAALTPKADRAGAVVRICRPDWFDPTQTWTVNRSLSEAAALTFTGEDLNFLARALYAEAAGRGAVTDEAIRSREKTAILHVCYFRLLRRGYPSNAYIARSFTDVLKAPGQFESVFAANRKLDHSRAAVAEALNAEAIPSPSGAGRWNATRVSEITRNPAYRGTLRWREGEREIVVPGAIPAILATP